MNKWVSETLLPSLYERYIARDPKHVGIIVSGKVNQILLDNMTADSHFGTWKPVVTGSSLYWRGRRVSLQNNGRYHILTFGLTDEERNAAADTEETRKLTKEIEDAKAAARRLTPERIARRIEKARGNLGGYKDYLEDPEATPEEISRAKMMVNHYETILAILRSA